MKDLRRRPHRLDDLYTQIISRLSKHERIETFRIFKWVMFASQQLDPLELCFELQFEAAGPFMTFLSWTQSQHFIKKGEQMERYIRSRSRGLLEIRNVARDIDIVSPSRSDAVRFIHHTVPEFLSRKGLALLQLSENSHMAGVCHHLIAVTCINYLSEPAIISCPFMKLLRFAASQNGSA